MKKLLMVLTGIAILTSSYYGTFAQDKPNEKSLIDGYPAANFTLSANISLNAAIFGDILYNAPQPETPLESLGAGQFIFKHKETTLKDNEFQNKTVKRAWPFADITLSDSRFTNLSIQAKTFAPLELDNAFTSSLPALMAEFTVENQSSEPSEISIAFDSAKILKAQIETIHSQAIDGLKDTACFAGWNAPQKGELKNNVYWITVSLKANEKQTCHFVYTHFESARFDNNLLIANKIKTQEDVAAHVIKNWDALKNSTQKLSDKIPSTGDISLDEYVRWNLTGAVMNTKVLKDKTVITCSTNEMNLRDSYWSGWMHLVLWPSLEKKMIQEIAASQKENGKIPANLFPVSDKEGDIDSTCYYILRVTRYTRLCNDLQFAKEIWPTVTKAFQYLYTLNDTTSSLPKLTASSSDWSSTLLPALKDRKCSPYITFLYLGAIRQAAEFTTGINDPGAFGDFRNYYRDAYRFLLTKVAEGGMYNEKYFQTVFTDPAKKDNTLSEDHVLGILFDVFLDEGISKTILEELKTAYTEFGPTAASPASPAYIEAVEGDGLTAVYPWLANIHAWALAKNGQKQEALTILKNMAAADLVKEGDFLPSGYINSKNGKNCGAKFSIANADIFATVYFGLVGNPLVTMEKNVQPPKAETPQSTNPTNTKTSKKTGIKEPTKKAPAKTGTKTPAKSNKSTAKE